MNNPGLIKNFTASGAVAAHRIVKLDANGCAVQASSASDAIVGVSENLGAADGERVDIVLSGIVEVDAGGSITVGDKLTADSNGKAVTASGGSDSFSAGSFPTLSGGEWPTIDDGALTGGSWPTLSGGTSPSFSQGTGNRVIGIALESASSGERVSVLIDRS